MRVCVCVYIFLGERQQFQLCIGNFSLENNYGFLLRESPVVGTLSVSAVSKPKVVIFFPFLPISFQILHSNGKPLKITTYFGVFCLSDIGGKNEC